MGSYFSDHSPAAFTKSKLKQMGREKVDMGEPPGEKASGAAESEDAYGHKAARDSAEYKRGGAVDKGKRPHIGRMGRAAGGRVGRAAGGALKEGTINTNNKTDGGMRRQSDEPLIRYARGGRTHSDEKEDRALIDKMVKPSAREGRARGGKTPGKGKTVVNIVVGGKGDQPQAAPPPPMPPPMPPPQPPQRPPMPPPGAGGPPIMMPPGGAPMGPAGAPPPPGPMPMRAHGGRVMNLGKYAHPPKAGFSDSKAPHRGGGKQGFSDVKQTSARAPEADGSCDFGKGGKRSFGEGGTPGRASLKETAGNNAIGRLEKARREYNA